MVVATASRKHEDPGRRLNEAIIAARLAESNRQGNAGGDDGDDEPTARKPFVC